MKIILPTDFSEISLNALEFAIVLAGKKDGEIILIHVIEAVFDFESQSAISLERMHQDANTLMEKTVEKYNGTDIKFTTLIKDGTASITVARIAEEYDATMIVMGTQGASGIKSALVGSTTIALIKETSVPVLVVPSEAKALVIRKIALALEFATHEEKFLDWVINMSLRWDLGMEFVHIQTSSTFEEEPGINKLDNFVTTNYPGLPVKIHTFYATTPVEGLDQFLEENENVILVMCHKHKNLWNQILDRSQTITMIFHSKVPLLVIP
ncbi:nucleotide-binding universal stress UspA family protein [Algoriphagus ratkowskyi]|uniref:Nucleotide-binding universal stress UspA family protein n=1 Tax=Algoriphagus ratkowskyi TaxID=57028 RepID=A0A2W7R2E5_9BACT|nr:universal stress protein [Algoriphagus ratkowskyi]PZX52420.1 nucleotide-binding universal stress UspA family protein [Algoriphagus ratkowskyi]TXD76232.1 universal stress protein [Algoriphagus ratkowskyi]